MEMGTTRWPNCSIIGNSLMAQVSKRSGLGPTSPILAPIQPLTALQAPRKLLMPWLNISSSGKQLPRKVKGILLLYRPEEIERVPQKASDLLPPSSVKGPSLVLKSKTGASGIFSAILTAEISSPKVIVPMMIPAKFLVLNSWITFSASLSSRTSPLGVKVSSGAINSKSVSLDMSLSALRVLLLISTAHSSLKGSR